VRELTLEPLAAADVPAARLIHGAPHRHDAPGREAEAGMPSGRPCRPGSGPARRLLPNLLGDPADFLRAPYDRSRTRSSRLRFTSRTRTS
jgi:hypothetical protein